MFISQILKGLAFALAILLGMALIFALTDSSKLEFLDSSQDVQICFIVLAILVMLGVAILVDPGILNLSLKLPR